jgi:DNA-binding beta-propeller fold protein YncE
MIWLGALPAGCAATAAGGAQPEPTAPPRPTPTVTPAPGAPLVLLGWDGTLGRVVRAVDPLTGEDAPGYAPLPIAGERDEMFMTPQLFAPDGRLALLDVVGQLCYPYAMGSTCGPRSSAVYLVDFATWALQPVPLPLDGWALQLAFSPDGRRLAVALRDDAGENTLLIIDTAAATIIGQGRLPIAPTRLGFGPDGATLMVYVQPEGDEPGLSPPPAPRVLLLDGATLAPIWETTLDDVTSGHWCVENCDADHGGRKMTSVVPGVALSAEGDKLYVVHAGADRLTTVDLAGRAVQTVDIGGDVAWLDRLLTLTAGVAHAKGPMDSFARYAVLSPDGARLYAGGTDFTMSANDSGGWDVAEVMQPLRALDPTSGRVLAEIDAPNHSLRLTPDGERLLVVDASGSASIVSALDAATLATVARTEGMDVMMTVDLAGKTRLVGQSYRQSQSTFALLDPLTLEVVAEWSADGQAWPATIP